MTTHDRPAGGTTSTTAATPSWFGIQTLGPVLMILFGIVLMFTPLASVGAAGSVGNAGAQFPKCPPAGGGGGQIGGGGGIQFPGDDCPTPTTAAPTTAPPATEPPSAPAPTTDAPMTTAPSDPPPPVEATPPVGSGTDEPEVGGIVVEAPDGESEVLDAREVRGGDTGGGSAGHDTAELAFTGPNDASLSATLLGGVLVLGGAALLFAGRRRSSTTC